MYFGSLFWPMKKILSGGCLCHTEHKQWTWCSARHFQAGFKQPFLSHLLLFAMLYYVCTLLLCDSGLLAINLNFSSLLPFFAIVISVSCSLLASEISPGWDSICMQKCQGGANYLNLKIREWGRKGPLMCGSTEKKSHSPFCWVHLILRGPWNIFSTDKTFIPLRDHRPDRNIIDTNSDCSKTSCPPKLFCAIIFPFRAVSVLMFVCS